MRTMTDNQRYSRGARDFTTPFGAVGRVVVTDVIPRAFQFTHKPQLMAPIERLDYYRRPFFPGMRSRNFFVRIPISIFISFLIYLRVVC